MKKRILGDPIRTGFFGLVCILVLFAVYLLFLVGMTAPLTKSSGYSLEKFAQFGDSFGILTSFFSAVAALIAATLLFQNMRDVREYRKQAKLSYLLEKGKMQPAFTVHVREFSEKIDKVNYAAKKAFPKEKYSSMLPGKSPWLAIELVGHGNLVFSGVRLCFRSKGGSNQVILPDILSFNGEAIFFIDLSTISSNAEGASPISWSFFVIYEDVSTMSVLQRFLMKKEDFLPQYLGTAFGEDSRDKETMETYQGCYDLWSERRNSV